MGNEVVLSTGQKNSAKTDDCKSGPRNASSFCQRDHLVMPDSVAAAGIRSQTRSRPCRLAPAMVPAAEEPLSPAPAQLQQG
jgi:hypothetical protein